MTTPDPLELAARAMAGHGVPFECAPIVRDVVRVYLTAAVEQMPVEVVRDLAIGLDCLYLPREEGEAKALVLSALLPRGGDK